MKKILLATILTSVLLYVDEDLRDFFKYLAYRTVGIFV